MRFLRENEIHPKLVENCMTTLRTISYGRLTSKCMICCRERAVEQCPKSYYFLVLSIYFLKDYSKNGVENHSSLWVHSLATTFPSSGFFPSYRVIRHNICERK